MMGRAKMALAGFFIGGFLGWLMGVMWQEFAELPKVASLDPMTAPTCLSAASNALPLLAVPGAILGAIVGALNSSCDNPEI